jgi:hypothetical protein
MTKRGVTAIAVATLALSAAPAFAKGGGWVVRICRGFTEAAAIKISVGSPGSKDKLLVNWHSDNKHDDFPVHGKLSTAKQLHVLADSEPADGKVAMCVLYKGAPAKAMNFKDLLEVTVSSSDADNSCQCPKSGGQ